MDKYGPSIYAHEKLLAALESLATGQGDVRKRLLAAYQTFHPLTQSHFPPHLRKDYGWVLKQLTKRVPIYDYRGRLDRGSVEETLRHIKNVTGAKIATRIYRLYHALAQKFAANLRLLTARHKRTGESGSRINECHGRPQLGGNVGPRTMSVFHECSTSNCRCPGSVAFGSICRG